VTRWPVTRFQLCVQPLNFGVHTAWRKAKDRDAWHQVVSTEFATKKKKNQLNWLTLRLTWRSVLGWRWHRVCSLTTSHRYPVNRVAADQPVLMSLPPRYRSTFKHAQHQCNDRISNVYCLLLQLLVYQCTIHRLTAGRCCIGASRLCFHWVDWKCRTWKWRTNLQDMKLQDMELQDRKMQDMKMTDQKWRQGVKWREKKGRKFQQR